MPSPSRAFGRRLRVEVSPLRTTAQYFLPAVFYLVFTTTCPAQDKWTGFRGDGSSIVSANLPTKWSAQEGVAWQSEIPCYGQSSPVLWNDHVYVTSTEGPFQRDSQVHAFDVNNGDKLWTTHVEATTSVIT